jgi:5-deoxy-glucuronate isomerase
VISIEGAEHDVSASQAEWEIISFQTVALTDDALARTTGEDEVAIVPLAGAVKITSRDFGGVVGGRESVFSGLPELLYLPPEYAYKITAAGGTARVAICGARAQRGAAPTHITPDDYDVELRGSGSASRQVVTPLPLEFPAERLVVVEVWTPGGNWSCFPPHKHDRERPPEESVLEETFFFQLRDPDRGFAIARVYDPERVSEVNYSVRQDDLLLVRHGYHTVAAVPGFDLYYLNAISGPVKSTAATDDPDLSWLRSSSATQLLDSRLPLIAG